MKDLLRVGTFRRLLGGWSIGNLADSALFLTLAVWAKDLTGSSAAAGMVFFALGAPALFVPVLGLLVDRVHRKPLMVAAHLVAAGAAASLVLITDASMLWLLYAVTVVYGALGILNGSALSGLLRDLLPDDQLDQANAMFSTIDQGLRIFTPMLGAGLYVLWGGRALGLGVATLLVITAVVLVSVRARESDPEREPEAFWAQTVAGFQHLRSVPVLWTMVTVVAVAFGVVGLFDTVLFEVVEHGLGMPAAFFGVLMTLQGAGAIVGGVTSARVLRRWGPLRAVGTSLGILGVVALASAGTVLGSALLPVVIVALFAGGIAIPWMVVAMVTTRQRLTPPRLQGRTAAAANLATTVPQIASIAAGAGLVAVVDYRILLLVAFAVLTSCAVALLRSARMTSVEAEVPATDAAEPRDAVEPTARRPDQIREGGLDVENSPDLDIEATLAGLLTAAESIESVPVPIRGVALCADASPVPPATSPPGKAAVSTSRRRSPASPKRIAAAAADRLRGNPARLLRRPVYSGGAPATGAGSGISSGR